MNGSVSGAKYRLMSPAKLPISRSACITIPPGLSPTSFIESPVLLSNMKAEPSPTTGSFFKAHSTQSSYGEAIPSMENPCLNNSSVDETKIGGFEFRFHTGTSSTSGLSCTNPKNHAGSNRNAQIIHKDQRHSQVSQPLASSSMHGLSLCKSDKSNEGGQSDFVVQASYSDSKDSIPLVPAERTTDDGYNWRKYGQKLVKGSEFPRSYYKCTYPNCEVKKIFERSHSGQITGIIYKGSHEHPKPQLARRNSPGAIQEDNLDEDSSFAIQSDKMNSNGIEQKGSPALSPRQDISDGGDGSASQHCSTNDNTEDDPFLKRRRLEDGMVDIAPVVIKPIREPRVVVQTVSEVDILDDGYRWRKYGQKVVRGNPNPRSYYKCTFAGCPVRKHVERASHDPKAVITTYEGKHSHDVPIGKNSNGQELASTSMPYSSSITSLDLGVGMGSHISENKTDEQIRASSYNDVGMRQMIQNDNPGMVVLRPSRISMEYGIRF